MKAGFDSEKYVRMQSEHIRARMDRFGGKLYLEFGGKLFDDYHASRVLPGFRPDSKISMLTELRDQAEAVVAVNANDIEKSKVRGDLGITYDMEVLRMVDAFRDRGFRVSGVVLTRYAGQPAADAFAAKLSALGVRTYRHHLIEGYPSNIPLIVSDAGYGRNEYIETSRPLVIVAAPGPGSGKMAVCLSQLYHESRRGSPAGYAKFETFPIWNLPLSHPVNIAYEAATADLSDKNMIDPFHLEACGETAVNYNRDVEVFPVLKAILETISGGSPYRSPTDMGVNMAGYCISDDSAVCEAARGEIVRRYFAALCDRKRGVGTDGAVYRLELLMNRAGASPELRRPVAAARRLSEAAGVAVAAVELADGRIVTGKASALMGASSAMLLNSLKVLAGIDDGIHLISADVIGAVQKLKVEYLGNTNPRLHADETLVALSVSANSDAHARLAFGRLPELRGCEMHTSVIMPPADGSVFRKLGVNVTSDPAYQTDCLFHAR